MMSSKPSKKQKKRLYRFIFFMILTMGLSSLAIATALAFAYYNKNEEMKMYMDVDVIYSNIYINDVDVGGLTADKAHEKLLSVYQEELDKKTITIKSPDKDFIYTYKDFDARLDFGKAVAEAYNFQRNGDLKTRYDTVQLLEGNPLKITAEPSYTYNPEKIQEIISQIEPQIYIKPVNATISRVNKKFTITEGSDGRRLDTAATTTLVKNILDRNESGSAACVMTTVLPDVTASSFDKAQSLIGSFNSTFTGALTLARNINIQVASSKINDCVVYPGEIFSTNKAFGESTYDNGYRSAATIVDGKLVDDIGGGVCQVSSTLYNALLYAELQIVERQNHSLKVGYMDWGFDATLAGDYIDLKFKNDTEYPVFIESYISGNKVYVNLYGHEIHDKGRSLTFKNALVETVNPQAEKVTEDPTLPNGERAIVTEAKTGYKYNVYKFVYQDGKEISKTLVNTSYYRPVRGEIRLGTGESVSSPNSTESIIPAINNGTDTEQHSRNLTADNETDVQQAIQNPDESLLEVYIPNPLIQPIIP